MKEQQLQLFKLLVVRGVFKTDRDYNMAKQTFTEVTGLDYEEEVNLGNI